MEEPLPVASSNAALSLSSRGNDNPPNEESDHNSNEQWLGLGLPNLDALVQTTTQFLDQVQVEVRQVQQNFVVDRPFIMTCIIFVVVSCLLAGAAFVGGTGLLAVLCLPIWLPLVILTAPVWMIGGFVSSPLWMTVGAMTIVVGTTVTTFLTVVTLFMAWPEEWLLPSRRQNSTVDWLLVQRRAVEVYVIKTEAKLVLYAAGVGPAVDAAFVILDRVDMQAVLDRLAQVNVEKLKTLDVTELQALVVEALQSLWQPSGEK